MAKRAVANAVGVLVAVALVASLAACGRNGSASAGGVSAAPHFVDEAAAAGIEHRYDGEFEYFVGGGVAAFDCDGDRRPDLYFAGGSAPAALYRNISSVAGALRFTPVPSSVTDMTAVTGAYPLDIDSDGVTDLVVLRRSAGNVLLRGLGDCAFEDANARFGFDSGHSWTAAFSATWEGAKQLPTLAFGNYLVPDTTECDSSELVRPDANGTAYSAPIPLSPGYCALSIVFSDWSRTGERDLRMANDRHYYIDGSEQLWRIVPNDQPRLYTEADGWNPLQLWGMGIASQDVTGDGLPEIFITSQGDNKLQTLADGPTRPTYRDIALKRGVTATRPYTGGDVLPSTAWHPEFADVNNDGFVDLFVSKGNVEAQPDYASHDPSNLLLEQSDGTFVEGAEDAGIVNFDRARGAALVDLNLDGLLDLVVVNRRQPADVYRNVGAGTAQQPQAMGHWLALDVQQPAPNVDAVGGWLEVRANGRTFVKEISVGGGHAGGQSGWIHAGLGDAAEADVRVQWPDGEMGPWLHIAADQFATIERGSAQATPWQPKE